MVIQRCKIFRVTTFVMLWVFSIVLYAPTSSSVRDPFNFAATPSVCGTGSIFHQNGNKVCVIERDKKQKLRIIWSAKKSPSTGTEPS